MTRLRGQMTMYAVIGTIISLIAFGSTADLINDQIDSLTTIFGADSIVIAILNFLPAAIALGILAGFLYYVSPSRGGY